MRNALQIVLALRLLGLSGCAVSGEPPAELVEPPPEDGKADSASRPAWVRSQIELWNEHLDEELRDEKFTVMEESPYTFFRATNHLYWSQLARDSRLSRYGGTSRTRTILQGDHHPENVGAFHDDEDGVVFDLNDFDEATLGDYQLDVWRMAIGIVLAGRENGVDDASLESVVEIFAEAYLDELSDLRGTDRETEARFDASSTSDPVSSFLVDVEDGESRLEMLEDWTVISSGERRLDLSSDDLERAPSAVVTEITRAIPAYGETLSGGLSYDASYFRVKSVARRLHAGAGSLGAPRFYVLIEGPSGAEDDDVILDVKRQDVPTGYWFSSSRVRSLMDEAFATDAERVVRAQRALLTNADDHLGWLELSDGSYSVRERSPWKKSLKLEELDTTSLESLAEQWGTILANAHARADRDFDDALVPHSLESEVHARTDGRHAQFRALVWTIASAGANQVERDYRSFLAR